MKLLFTFLIVIFFVGCRYWGRESKKHTRYFLIGYDISNSYRRDVGNFTSWGDSLPSKEYFRGLLYKWKKCYGYSYDEVVIVGVYEFKDSLEYSRWQNPTGEILNDSTECETTYIHFGGSLATDTITTQHYYLPKHQQ